MAVNAVSQTQLDYMNLLVTELKNQNPMKPMDNQEMTAQMTQFSELQQLESISGSFKDALQSANLNYASTLLGKKITFNVSDENGNTQSVNAVVEKVAKGEDDKVTLVTGGGIVNLSDVVSIENN
jgi:flagellar basal-body rod modification protein FlgD